MDCSTHSIFPPPCLSHSAAALPAMHIAPLNDLHGIPLLMVEFPGLFAEKPTLAPVSMSSRSLHRTSMVWFLKFISGEPTRLLKIRQLSLLFFRFCDYTRLQ